MPEGHTIHRIARDHGRLLTGRPLAVSSPQGRFAHDAAVVDGSVLDDLEAYGKHLFYHWSNGAVGHVHLGLFGKFRVHRTEPPEARGAIRMRLVTADDDDPVTVDLRGPTACTIGTDDDRRRIVERLGPDPLRADADPNRVLDRIGSSRAPIGSLLLDQSVLCGVGNVYRAEVLFVHGIHPLTAGRDIARRELDAMWKTIVTMLRAGVRSNRIVTVSREELDIGPRKRIPRREATYVYKRRSCLRCLTDIAVVEVANRSCYFCPGCQPAGRGRSTGSVPSDHA